MEETNNVYVIKDFKEVSRASVESLFANLGVDTTILSRDVLKEEARTNIIVRANSVNKVTDPKQAIEKRALYYMTKLLGNLVVARDLGQPEASLYVPLYPHEDDEVKGALDIVEAAMVDLGYSPKREKGPMRHSTEEFINGIDTPTYHRLIVRLFS